jgi:hypothetical protein
VLALVVPFATSAPPKPASGAMVVIADVSVNADTPSIDFSSIPQTYKHLQIVASLRSTRADQPWDPVRIRFNGDLGANYQNVWQWTVDGQVGTTEENAATGGYTEAMAASAPSGSFAAITGTIPDYANPAMTEKNFMTASAGLKGATSPHHVDAGGGWNSRGTAINRITLVPDAGNFVAGSHVTLYGMG